MTTLRCFAPARLAGPLSTQLLCPHRRSLPDPSSGSHGIRRPSCNLPPRSFHSHCSEALALHHSGGLRATTQTVIRTIRNCCVRLKIEDPTSVLRHANSKTFACLNSRRASRLAKRPYPITLIRMISNTRSHTSAYSVRSACYSSHFFLQGNRAK